MNDLIVLILSFYFFLTIVVVIYGKNYNSNIRIFNYYFDSMYVPANVITIKSMCENNQILKF
ncbi:hypothetical protein PFAG_00877 [Plasmodium falciparum Santa Lucia]|uniref:Uncharacterized protein n=2 Tax=Plasmodium falciparum TaxID=5833 RepID=W7FHN8_PLAF8|nr:hypothetical protein PFBG_00906 [Plasmodium falciparum 7G8]EUT90521.1 hypothetical protein PFAG_00877 [Plasmodium falciparum Santa Lucia]